MKSVKQDLIELLKQAILVCDIELDSTDKEHKKDRVAATNAWLQLHSVQYMKEIEQKMSVVKEMLKPGGKDLADIMHALNTKHALTSSKLQLMLPTNPNPMQRVRYLTELALVMVKDVGRVLLKMAPFSENFLRQKCKGMQCIFDKEPEHMKHAWVRLLLFMRVMWPGSVTEDEMRGGLLTKDNQEIEAQALAKLDKIKEMTPPVYNLDSDGISLENRIDLYGPFDFKMHTSIETTGEKLERKLNAIELEDEMDPLAVDHLVSPFLQMHTASKQMQALMLRVQDEMSDINEDDEAEGRRVQSRSAATGKTNPAIVLVNPSDKLKEVLSWVAEQENDTGTDVEACKRIICTHLEKFVSPSVLNELSKPLCQCSMYKKLLLVQSVIEELHKQIALEEFIGSMSEHFQDLLHSSHEDEFLLSEPQVLSMMKCPRTYNIIDMMLNVEKYRAGNVDMHKAFHIYKSTS